MARLFLVAGDDARCVRFCWWVTLSTVTFVGLDRPFLPDDFFSRRPPSRIPNQQGTLIRVALWQRVDIASALFSWWHLKCTLISSQSPSWQPNGFMFALIRIVLQCRAAFAFALWWDHIKLSLALSRRRLDFAPSHTLRPGHPNASGLAAMALSALPVSSTPAVPSARAGAAPMIGNAARCPRSRPRQQARKGQWPQGS